MSMPDEKRRAILSSKEFLVTLLDPRTTRRVPRSIREQAARCLRHYPAKIEIAQFKMIGEEGFHVR